MSHRYNKWTESQDQCLLQIISIDGPHNWCDVANKLKNQYHISKRNGKQCRERWFNHLNQDLNTQKWSVDQDLQLFQMHAKYGNKWIEITRHFQGRTDNQVKNRFYAIIKKSLRAMCKSIDIKTSSIRIYSIKPSVFSMIFHMGGSLPQIRATQDHHKLQKWVSQTISCQECFQITQIIKKFIFDNNKNKTQLSGLERERVREAIFKMIELNKLYQKDSNSNKQISIESYQSLSNNQNEVEIQTSLNYHEKRQEQMDEEKENPQDLKENIDVIAVQTISNEKQCFKNDKKSEQLLIQKYKCGTRCKNDMSQENISASQILSLINPKIHIVYESEDSLYLDDFDDWIKPQFNLPQLQMMKVYSTPRVLSVSKKLIDQLQMNQKE